MVTSLNCNQAFKRIVNIARNHKKVWRTLEKDESIPVRYTSYVEELLKVTTGQVDIIYVDDPSCLKIKLENYGFKYDMLKVSRDTFLQVQFMDKAVKVSLVKYKYVKHVPLTIRIKRTKNATEFVKRVEDIIRSYSYNELVIASLIKKTKVYGVFKNVWFSAPAYVVIYNVAFATKIPIEEVPQLIANIRGEER